MTRDETLALWRKTDEARAAALAEGKTVEQANELAVLIWNSWAKEMISKREELQRQGLWKIGRGEWGKQEPQNTETHIWLQEAWADFAGVRFDGGHIKSQNADLSFGGFMFPGGASFESAEFSKGANFLAARFDGDADFDHAVFRDAANLREVQFFWKAAFAFVTFVGWTSFINSIFYERSRFSGSQFQSMADFSNVQFRSPRVLSFRRTIFRQAALFRHARFLGGLADFRGMSAEHAFDITYAQFEKLPWFNQANFKEAPDFDQVLYPIPSFLSSLLYHRRETSIDPNVFPNSTLTEEDYDRYNATIAISPSYRALRRLAIQGHDHENESKAFKGEVRSKRWMTDKPWHLAFWFGIFYDLFSDFGRSALVPALWWALTVVVASMYYLSQHPGIAADQQKVTISNSSGFVSFLGSTFASFATPIQCYTPPPSSNSDQDGRLGALIKEVRERTDAKNEAFQLAFRSGFVFLDSSGDAAHRSLGCLYGVELYGGSNPIAYVPSAVSMAMTIQKLVSGVLIFLFGLAVRNMLKVK